MVFDNDSLSIIQHRLKYFTQTSYLGCWDGGIALSLLYIENSYEFESKFLIVL